MNFVRRAIAVAISLRRLSAQSFDEFIALRPVPMGSHALLGLAFALLIPLQLSATVRQRYRRVHRWAGRVFVVLALLLGISAYGMMLVPLGIAATRPIMAIFFATSSLTKLGPPQFFGIAMWIGFTLTVVATERYIRSTRTLPQDYAPYSSRRRTQ